MVPGIEPYYQRLANSIMGVAPKNWERLIAQSTFYEGSARHFCECVKGGKSQSIPTPNDWDEILRELRTLFQIHDKKVWGQAEFTLTNSGEFNLDWGYEHLDENGFTKFDADKFLAENEARRKRLSGG
ncbi:MAG: immunity protein YezG family protein [Planctomycetota bacterium]